MKQQHIATMHIWLVGATNVGKSSLFNRLIGQFRAIVTEVHGTTQDILMHTVQHEALWELVFSDSPWLTSFDEEWLFITTLVESSDLLLFVMDKNVGITAKEQRIHEYIQQNGFQDKVVFVVNKYDAPMSDDDYLIALSEYYGMWYEDVVGVSAKAGHNISMLWSIMQGKIKNVAEQHEAKKHIHKKIPLAIVGKPNAGKSTLMNTLAKKHISRVEDKPGTTLDYLQHDIVYDKKEYTLYDTAGIRKKAKTRGLEKIAYDKTISMIKYVRPIVVYLLDMTQGLTHRDMTLIEEIHNKAVPFLIALNKTDTVEKEEYRKYVEDLAKRFNHMKYVPIVPISALNGKGFGNLFTMVGRLYKESRKKVSTGELNSIVTKEFITRPPRFPKNKICKIFYMTQVDNNPPKFMIFVNHLNRANFSFKRWVENTIRKHYGFIGVPLVLIYRGREEKKHSEHSRDFQDRIRHERDRELGLEEEE